MPHCMNIYIYVHMYTANSGELYVHVQITPISRATQGIVYLRKGCGWGIEQVTEGRGLTATDMDM